MANISKISKIPIREEFPHEAHDFTPWLKENLHYIAEELHLEFRDDVLTEVEVGPYSCDVLAETEDGKKVVIENQFDRADHDHLGKMLTYAAGLNADMLIFQTDVSGVMDVRKRVIPHMTTLQAKELIDTGIAISTENLDELISNETNLPYQSILLHKYQDLFWFHPDNPQNTSTIYSRIESRMDLSSHQDQQKSY